ncbi:MAG: hypothetical protein ACE15C_18970 [Phycisphaerae bacterium]
MKEDSKLDRRDLTEGWPQDEGNEDLANFAERLAASPGLPAGAVERIAGAMAKEMQAHPRVVRAWWVRALRTGLAAAAAVLLATGAYFTLRGGGTTEHGRPPVSHAAVTDKYAVAYAGVPAPAAPQAPLIGTEPYRSLIESTK